MQSQALVLYRHSHALHDLWEELSEREDIYRYVIPEFLMYLDVKLSARRTNENLRQ